MIPLHLSLSGFLSYRDPVEIDFSTVDLACISGANGAGKSSLLDAITWALFGQARKRDDSLINTQCDAAMVVLTFAYENNIYRVLRSKQREKPTDLQFQILQLPEQESYTGTGDLRHRSGGRWKALTERTLRDTEALIRRTLRLDYETFVNASFFLQGKADLFTQQPPGDRKRILGSILGLEVWETYRQRAAEMRRKVELEIVSLDARMKDIKTELAEEAERKRRLKQLESDLKRLSTAREAQETALEAMRKVVATLAEQARFVDTLARQAESAAGLLSELEKRAEIRRQERESYAQELSVAETIQAEYQAWQQARIDLAYWDEIAVRFRDHEKQRQAPLDEINATRARLKQELEDLRVRKDQVEAGQAESESLIKQTEVARQDVAQSEALLARRGRLDQELQTARQRQAEARAENPHLKSEMDELKERMAQLSQAEGATCPLCGQPLSHVERQALVESLGSQGKELGDRYRANQALLRDSDRRVAELEAEIGSLSRVEISLRQQTQTVAQLSSRMEVLIAQQAAWEAEAASRFEEVLSALSSENFAPQARSLLEQIDAELKATGYDAAAHDRARKAELEGRSAEARLRSLETARAALQPLEREIADLEAAIQGQRVEVSRQQEEHAEHAEALSAAQAQAPDLAAAERDFYALQEEENRLRMEVGAARQKVSVLDDLKARHQALEMQREEQARLGSHYRSLERAFGKDGVPALLIEQALPQIESRSNEILDRLSSGNMSVRFVTLAAYKDKHREDLRETLEIQISDSTGSRDYDLFSGGEGFRVNFAIRLALAEVLAQRVGARLQTLVIDEGFGSQDNEGRQRLIEAINQVRQDFAKVLVITHIDELKDAFPARIEVEKTSRGSTATVI